MSFSAELVDHASQLLGSEAPTTSPDGPPVVDLRRAISAAYYALFHHLSEAAAKQIAPSVHLEAANRIHRWLDHSEMKRVCGEFARPKLRAPLSDLLGETATAEMQTVAAAFIRLQEERHRADYDLLYIPNKWQTQEFILMAIKAIHAWNKISPSAESNIFVLSLLLWKKWESARQ